ncbi:hypothetical protein Bca4012_089857 [Brassica carinata]
MSIIHPDEKEVHVEIGPVDENEKSNTPIGAALSADDATVRDLVGDALAQTLRLSWLLWSAIWHPDAKAVYGTLFEAEHRSTFYFPYWNFPPARWISGLFKPDLDLITRGSSEYRQRTQSNGYWNCAKVSERVKKRSYSNRGDYRRDEGRSGYRNSRYEPSRGYAQEDRNRFARGSRRETSQLRDVMEEDHEEGEFQNKVREVKEDHQGDKEISQTKNVLAVQMELTLPQIVSYVVILDSIIMEDGVDLGNKMLEEGINGLREDVMVLDDKHVNMSGKGKNENDDDKFLNITDDLMYQYIIGKQLWSSVVVFDSFEEDTLVMWITLFQVYILESDSEVEYGVHCVSALVVGLIKPNMKPGSVQE